MYGSVKENSAFLRKQAIIDPLPKFKTPSPCIDVKVYTVQ
jgi:hypothetical protein